MPYNMASHMKTTIQIADSLFEEARRLAEREHTTLKALVEQGLRRTLAERKRRPAFRLRRATYKGKGLQSSVADAPWEQIRELTYRGRGA